MSKIVLLVVGAAWAAVLLPPLLRSRVENRPNSSVVDFRRRLSTLQRTVPARGMSPMRSMARPLAPSPVRSGPRSHGSRVAAVPRLTEAHRSAVTPMPGARQHRSHAAEPMVRASRPQTSTVRRASAPARPSNARERMRQRRQNVLFVLVAVTAATAFLAATTRSSMMVYAFVLAAVSLAGFCYKLVQIRRQGDMKVYGESWFRAA